MVYQKAKQHENLRTFKKDETTSLGDSLKCYQVGRNYRDVYFHE